VSKWHCLLVFLAGVVQATWIPNILVTELESPLSYITSCMHSPSLYCLCIVISVYFLYLLIYSCHIRCWYLMLCILGMPGAALTSCFCFFSFCVSPSVKGVLTLFLCQFVLLSYYLIRVSATVPNLKPGFSKEEFNTLPYLSGKLITSSLLQK